MSAFVRLKWSLANLYLGYLMALFNLYIFKDNWI